MTKLLNWQVKVDLGSQGLFMTNTKAMNAIVEHFKTAVTSDVLEVLVSFYGEELAGWSELNKFELMVILGEIGFAYYELDEKFLSS